MDYISIDYISMDYISMDYISMGYISPPGWLADQITERRKPSSIAAPLHSLPNHSMMRWKAEQPPKHSCHLSDSQSLIEVGESDERA